MSARKIIKIGARGSPLALRQVSEVVSSLRKKHPKIKIKIVKIRTSGDRFQSNKRLPAFGSYAGKGLFVKEIETALLEKKVDLAVHSLKDVPRILARGLFLAAFLKREDPKDIFISSTCRSLEDLPAGSVVGTSSPRRTAYVKALRPDLKIITLRGNVETRLQKIEDGEADATIMASAGLRRLGLYDKIRNKRPLENLVPAVGQGIICVEMRYGDYGLKKLVRAALNDKNSEKMALAERQFLSVVGGDCESSIGARAVIANNFTKLTGFVSSHDGKKKIRKTVITKDPVVAGRRLGEKFVKLGARKILKLEKYIAPKRIILTGLPETNENLKAKFCRKFDEFIEIPLIKIVLPTDRYASVKRAILNISNYDWAVFTSKNAAASFFRFAKRIKKLPKIAAVGKSTARKLKEFGVKKCVIPGGEDGSNGLLDEFARFDLRRKTVLVVGAEDGLNILHKGFARMGAIVERAFGYRTVLLKPRMKGIKADAIFFASPSARRAREKTILPEFFPAIVSDA